ncbi:TPA: hypothetical protein IAB95_00805 [Candidatus Ventrenecus avicola]|nr:hypothetical protein [Candidatus Ventrenecus avicola]
MLGWLNSIFHKIVLLLDSVIYWAVSMAYQLFIRLATLRLFEDSFFSEFANRIYAILGVFMLFYLAYALLNALIDPEKLSGDKGFSKIASNLIVSLVLLGLIPTIFEYAYRLQNYVLSSNLIGAIILNTATTNPNDSESTTATQESMIHFGDSLAFTVMNTFINPDNYNVKFFDNYNWYDYKADVLENSSYTKLPALSDAVIHTQVDATTQEEVNVEYYIGISTAVGIFLLYIIISFTIDLGVRVVKFAFCQLIAPIPIIMRAMPGKKSTFDKWLKTTLSVYFEVFVRVAIMYIAVYFIRALYLNWDWEQFSGIQGKLVLVVVIMGILTFAKQAPKMLSDMLGIESGNLKLGIGEKLKAGGFFAGGAMLGAGVTGLVQRGVSGIRGIGNRWGETHGFLNKGKLLAGGLLGTAGSMVAGSASGMFHSFKSGKDAKNFGDMRKAASEGAKISLDNKGKREAYKAVHGGTVRGAMAGHFGDMAFNAREWATGNKLGVLTAAEQHKYDVLTDFESRVKAYEGLWKNEKAWIDADANARNARVQSTVAKQNFDSFAAGATSSFYSKINEIASRNPGMTTSQVFSAAYDSLIDSGLDESTNTAILNNYDSMVNAFDTMKTSTVEAEQAQKILDATTADIQKKKEQAMGSMQTQIDMFRDAHKDLASAIGKSGESPTATKFEDSGYVKELNKLKAKMAQAEIKKDKK